MSEPDNNKKFYEEQDGHDYSERETIITEIVKILASSDYNVEELEEFGNMLMSRHANFNTIVKEKVKALQDTSPVEQSIQLYKHIDCTSLWVICTEGIKGIVSACPVEEILPECFIDKDSNFKISDFSKLETTQIVEFKLTDKHNEYLKAITDKLILA